MSGSLDPLIAATVLFVGGHFLLSSAPMRGPLVNRFGERIFAGLYSLFAVIAFVWMLVAYRDAPFVAVWTPAPIFHWVPIMVMPFALILAVCGLTIASPTLGPRDRIDWAGRDPTAGIIRVTRHPFLVGVALWAGAHLLANGDAATMILIGGMLVLALGGMWHIDLKKEARLGAEWGPILLTTSVLPFAAIATGRTTMDWRGIGLWRPALALLLYVGLIHLHPVLIGVPVWPA